jgi:hypothetical protein
MTMPASGALNMGGTTTPQSVANELGLGLTTTISMNQAAVRTLAGAGGSGTTWSMNSLYGKSAGFATVSLATIPASTDAYYQGDFAIDVTLILLSNGTWETTDDTGVIDTGNWGSPTASGAGAAYWVKFTRTSFTPIGGGSQSTATTAWLNLSVYQFIAATCNFGDLNGATGTYTIEIATDSAGSNVIATRTGIQIGAFPTAPP